MATTLSSCPLCEEDKPGKESELPIINFEECFVIRGKEHIGFKEATRGYIDKHYQDIEKQAYKVPSAFYYHQDEKLDFVADAKLYDFLSNYQGQKLEGPSTLDKILEDRRQKEAVETVAAAIHSFGKKNRMAMFVLSEFKFKHFLTHTMKKHNESTFKKVNFKEIYGTSGDHDILVFSMEKGIIALQVKSVTASSKPRTKRQQLKGAMKQIMKDKRAIRTMNRDLEFIDSLPVLGIVAVPNLSDIHLDDVGVCACHKKIVLTSGHLRNEGCFSKWWMQQYHLDTIPQKNVMSLEEYRELCGRYVGLASVVKYPTLSDAINQMGRKVGVMLLTPEQNDVLSAEQRLNILLGDYGTGKSLLIIHMANTLAQKAKETSAECDIVYAISFATVSSGSGKIQKETDNSVDLLQKFSRNKDSKNLNITSFYEHITNLEEWEGTKFPEQPLQYPFQLTVDFLCQIMRITLEKHPSETVHFLFDEVPLCIGKSKRRVEETSERNEWTDFESFCSENRKMTVWMSIAAYSYALGVDEDYSCLYEHLPTSFTKTIFTQCMRMCRNGFRLVQAVREFKGDGHYAIAECGNVINGPFPIWYELTSCTCLETSMDLPSIYTCRCVGERLKITLQSILKEVFGTNLNDIAIILHDTSSAMTQFLTRNVEKACACLNVRVNFKVSSVAQRSTDLQKDDTREDDTRDDNTREDDTEDTTRGDNIRKKSEMVTLVDYWSYKGSEEKVVIYIDPYGGSLVWNIQSRWHGYQDVAGAFSRALAQIFYVTWPEEEQRKFYLALADNLEKTAPPEAEDPTGRDFKLGIAEAIRNGRKGHKWEGRNFMNYLIEKQVITRHNAVS